MCAGILTLFALLLATTGAGDAALTSEINLLLKLYEWKNIKCP